MIDTNEDVIVDEILSFIEYTNKQNAEKTKLEEANAKAKTDAEELAKKNETPKEEKKGGLGWFIFGAVVLVATAGVVNVMKNK